MWNAISLDQEFWTRVAVSISYDDNHYTTGTSITETILLTFDSFKKMLPTNYLL